VENPDQWILHRVNESLEEIPSYGSEMSYLDKLNNPI